MNKKGDGGLTAVLIIIIIIILIGWMVNMGGKECRDNGDCRENNYCGSDFECHKFPVIKEASTIIEKDYTAPSIIIGISLIIMSLILRWDKLGLNRISFKRKDVKEEPIYYNCPPYYTEQRSK